MRVPPVRAFLALALSAAAAGAEDPDLPRLRGVQEQGELEGGRRRWRSTPAPHAGRSKRSA